MAGAAVVDRFLDIFTTKIDRGFDLLLPEVNAVASVLVLVDVTLAFLFAAWAGDDVIERLVKKTLYVGFFAYLLHNYNRLAAALFDSMAGLGLLAAGSPVPVADFIQPGRLAWIGVESARPLLTAIGDLASLTGVFSNFVQIIILLLAWAVVVLAFFVLAIVLLVTLVEFKVATLAGFVLVPFGLWGKSAFLAERVLGHVMGCGIKVLVLALVVGIGNTLFAEIRAAVPAEPTIDDALTIMLASLTLLGIGLFSVSIASGLTAGAPQLGPGAAVGTAITAASMVYGAAALTRGGASIGRITGAMAEERREARMATLREGVTAQFTRLHAQAPKAPTSGAAKQASPPEWATGIRSSRGAHAAHGAAGAMHTTSPTPGITPKLDPDAQ